ncbi:probable serine hydrolase isoform X2 [Harpegnathos saltator]|uniref:Probable serine hydrolase n=2 Tax=Harpegnathos saltator TaxID=610380 RepID=E2BN88_HARSA|nr:probable serine hydrolase isoform X2 [Harpegnathos saltator]EFN82850.1 Probable serine hydrolase [Harpegnathos saltator]
MYARRLITFGAGINLCTKVLWRTLHNKIKEAHLTKNIEIPVPWGKVTGKLWGSQDKQPILAMHGWQDNAATFNNLAPLIVKNTPVLSIDLPGHGFSSWLPPGSIYTEIVYLLLIRRIVKYFEWEKVKILAHSLSSMTTYWYAAIYPAEVQYVIALDYFKFIAVNIDYYADIFGNVINSLIKLEGNTGSQPSYTKDKIKEKWLGGYIHMNEAASNILMTRGVHQKDDGTYVFNRDPRIRIIPIHTLFSKEQLECFAKKITCPYLILKGTESPYIELKEDYHNALQIMKQHNKHVYYEEVPGNHHFHLTHAEPAAIIINRFLEKYD